MGAGVGTFLKCNGNGVLLQENMVIQLGANLYCLVNIITR